MITRIVKMHFREEETENFKALFEQVKNKIEDCEGCEGVTLLNDIKHPEIFFTVSKWQEPAHLELYRTSTLFGDTWKKTKAMFQEKAQAWSTTEASCNS